jgi:phosphoadenosine phosphosulfate reductase
MLWKNGSFVDDPWRTIAEGEDPPPAGHIILPLDWWLQERDAFASSNAPIGLRIEPGTSIESFAQDLGRVSLIALAFPKFGDGRGFSTAALLRERYGFRGEIRAVGDVLLDQMQMMERCGFDAFEIKDPTVQRLLAERGAPAYARFYQPGAGAEAQTGPRPWARRRA